MQSFDFVDEQLRPAVHSFVGQSVLPNDSILLQRTPFTYRSTSWDVFWIACQALQQQIKPQWVFIDACWDPFSGSAEFIVEQRLRLNKIWPNSKVCILSSRAQHYYDNILGCVYFPLFLMINYPDLVERPRLGRIGCLNRRNAVHRVWLMYHLLRDKLIDSQRDVYSVRFTNIYTNNYYNVNGTLGITWFNQVQEQWPKEIQTHPDGFPNDYSIEHPAWHTGITIITETEPGADTLICEKTAKGILSKSCFTIYMDESGYRVLEDLGFQPRFFPEHAEEFNIEPIIKICRDISTQSQAMEYRNMHMDKIQHNFNWFAYGQKSFQERPWWQNYRLKLQQALDSL